MLGQLGPGVGAITVQVQRAARDHDPAVAHAGHHVFILDVIGEGDGRVARVGARFAADRQLPVQHDPLGGQFQVGIVGEGEFAVDGQTAQRGRTDVEDHVLVSADGDLVARDRHLAVWPGVRIRPLRRLGRRRSGILSLSDSEHAAEQECRNERCKKDRAILFAHDINPPYSKTTRYSSRTGKRGCLEKTPHDATPPRFAQFAMEN